MTTIKKAAGGKPAACARDKGGTIPPSFEKNCSTKSGKSQYFFPRHGKICGDVWRKRVRASVHLLRKPKPAWAVDVDDLDAARRCGATSIEIVDTESGDVYRCEVSRFLAYASRFNRGAGDQAALPLGFWRKSAAAEPQEATQLRMAGL